MVSIYEGVRISSPNESYLLKLIPIKKNSAYEYKESDFIHFMGRPAQAREKKNYRLQKGVNASEDSVYIVSSSLPESITIGDKCQFLGKIWTVGSVGYYFDNSKIVNASIFDEEYIIAKCQKGITLQ